MARYIMAIDEGTTGNTVLIVDKRGASRQGDKGVPQYYRSRAGWSTTPWRSGPAPCDDR